MGFMEGGRYLPGDYVDEGKLLLFIKEKVASRPPRRGQSLKAERKRKRTAAAAELLSEGPPPKRKREKNSVPSAAFEELLVESDNDETCSEPVPMYNTVRSYCSAINELWAYQTSLGLHNAAHRLPKASTNADVMGSQTVGWLRYEMGTLPLRLLILQERSGPSA
ncbi:hypothetical protein TSTA_008340 [Talaromyces stipitatus ATCC 10500]|uniref:Uncharacterized protein n=1 Tax=Talaromyces stipitatus (strain ATCC 10500 / CBS 375.48 / QM 6759 / NRRL 1006) TaxID=441959 RepID=B8MV82_TALSN|nr:uncharacterized protein TSTA_008340 [Talaromyces stipitatus ATCC 10500]EED11538.1 hypothetical protein TSTA_008340 [Talaromyces stipitatus ATCC 10500]